MGYDYFWSSFVIFMHLQFSQGSISIKIHVFWEGSKILQNLHRRFDRYNIEQIYRGDFANLIVAWKHYAPSKQDGEIPN